MKIYPQEKEEKRKSMRMVDFHVQFHKRVMSLPVNPGCTMMYHKPPKPPGNYREGWGEEGHRSRKKRKRKKKKKNKKKRKEKRKENIPMANS